MTSMNIAALVLRHGRMRPQSEAIRDGERSITYGELTQLVLRTASYLKNLGLTPRDRVGICLKDSADFIVALLGTTVLGAVAVPLDWRARPAENGQLIKPADVKLVLVEPGALPIAACSNVPVDAAWHSAVARLQAAQPARTNWNDPFIISASSGSTGAPKLTLMTHLQYYFAMSGMLEVMGLAGSHRYLNTLPFYFASGRNSTMAHLLRGDCAILYSRLFDAGEYAEIARCRAATVGVMVPTMVRRLLASWRRDVPLLPGFDALYCCGAPLYPAEKLEALHRLTPRFHDRYGTAETLVIAALRPEAIARRPESVGQPHSLGEIEVVDDRDCLLPTGATGHLRYRAPGLALPLPGTSAEAAFRGGWFYPGEIAHVDDFGFIFFQGRASEIIVRGGGVKINPAEIEQVLCEHPDIMEAAVIGQTVANKEESAVAFVVARREMPVSDLIAHCRARLTTHKVPQQFQFLSQLPKNTAGKIDKPALRALMPDA